jgi:hypothetical protein
VTPRLAEQGDPRVHATDTSVPLTGHELLSPERSLLRYPAARRCRVSATRRAVLGGTSDTPGPKANEIGATY